MSGFESLNQSSSFPEVKIMTHCEQIKKKAIAVANQIIRKQNKKLFKEIMNYLLKAKFLVGMTEIKLTTTLRKKIFGLMKQSSSINEDNVQFIDSKYDELLDDEDYNKFD